MPPKKVLISYSHDSDAHSKRVRGLADSLRRDGVDCQIDQYIPAGPPEGWPLWMENMIEWADYVLCVCTETYHRRVKKREKEGEGLGATWEAHLIYQEIYESKVEQLKFKPVIFEQSDKKYIPKPIRGNHYLLKEDDQDSYNRLYSILTGQKKGAPKLGAIKSITQDPSTPIFSEPGEPPPKPDELPEPDRLFIAYSREDTEFVLRLAKDLREAGVRLWLDQLDILPGHRWDNAVERAMEESSKILVILSPDSVSSEHVQDEVAYGLEERKQVIPVLYRKCKIPLRLRRLHRVDFSIGYSQGLPQLLLQATSAKGQANSETQFPVATAGGEVTELLESLRQAETPVERAAAGLALAEVGDPREAVMTLKGMRFCFVPAGDFSYQGKREERDYDYWISQFPITCAQFNEFVEDGGYGIDDFWEEAGGHRPSGPRELPAEFAAANQPVTEVSWFETVAFTKWLTDRWRKSGILDAGTSVRLPTEKEWEKSARGGVEIPEEPLVEPVTGLRKFNGTLIANPNPERYYPWGDNIQPDLANYDDVGIERPSAVGCFPKGISPYGCLEMSGNVQEWTGSLLERTGVFPVIRGGSFSYTADDARVSDREWSFPDSWDVNLGFRVVLAAADP